MLSWIASLTRLQIIGHQDVGAKITGAKTLSLKLLFMINILILLQDGYVFFSVSACSEFSETMGAAVCEVLGCGHLQRAPWDGIQGVRQQQLLPGIIPGYALPMYAPSMVRKGVEF